MPEPPPPKILTPPSTVLQRWNQCVATQHTTHSLIFELIDNSIQHRSKHPLRIHIIIKESDKDPNFASEIDYIDNGKGMAVDILPAAFTMNGMAGQHDPNGISEHGVGMKHALRGLSIEPSCKTRATGDNYRTDLSTEDIESFVNGVEIEPHYKTDGKISFSFPKRKEENFEYNHGTIFSLRNLEHRGGAVLEKASSKNTLDSLIRKIGQRYRYFLHDPAVFGSNPDDGIKIYRLTKKGKLRTDYPEKIEHAVYPLYGENRKTFEPKKPLFKDYKLHTVDDDWKATITIGTAPRTKEEWETCYPGNSNEWRRNRRDPYYVSQKNAGLDLVFKKLVMATAWTGRRDSIFLGVGPRNVASYLRGELKLESGFKTPQDKVTVAHDENFASVISRLNDILNGIIAGPEGEEIKWWAHYIMWETTGPKAEPEQKIANGYKEWLDKKREKPGNPAAAAGFPKTVKTGRKYTRCLGEADLHVNGDDNKKRVLVEVKAENVRAQDVFQLFMYMRSSKTRYGILVGPNFTDEANVTANWIMNNEKHGPFYWRKSYKIHFHTYPGDGAGDEAYKD